jgi:hypothetical protein
MKRAHRPCRIADLGGRETSYDVRRLEQIWHSCACDRSRRWVTDASRNRSSAAIAMVFFPRVYS